VPLFLFLIPNPARASRSAAEIGVMFDGSAARSRRLSISASISDRR
jgi:hypothetical protein